LQRRPALNPERKKSILFPAIRPAFAIQKLVADLDQGALKPWKNARKILL
jgi:hypothetical protein